VDDGAPLLEVQDLVVEVAAPPGRRKVVDGVGFMVRAGATVAMVGPSGAGKTLTALAVMGLLDANAACLAGGRIIVQGQDLAGAPESVLRAFRGRVVAMVFQEPATALDPTMRVGAVIAEAARALLRLGRAPSRTRALDLLAEVGLPDPAATARAYPHQLSGGMRQRVLVALALAGNPAVLLADEPTSALDSTARAALLGHLRRLQRSRGLGLLLVTHDLASVAEFADRVVVMERGRVVEEGPVSRVLALPTHPCTRALLAARPPPAGKTTGAEGLPGSGVPVLAVDRLTRDFTTGGWLGIRSRRVRAVDGVTLTVGPGECVGVVGESGSGKSTLARLALGLLRPSAGTVAWGGRDVGAVSAAGLRLLRRQVQVVLQDPGGALDPRVRVGDLLREPGVVQGMPAREVEERLQEVSAMVGLPPGLDRRFPHELSGGERQRVALARALLLRPSLLVCDEPFSALDATLQGLVVETLARLRRSAGLSLLFISHDLAVVGQVADRVVVMAGGRVVEDAGQGPLFSSPRHPLTRALLAAAGVGQVCQPVDAAMAPPPEVGLCPYLARCSRAGDTCRTRAPNLRAVSPSHLVACHHPVVDSLPATREPLG
jgi:peptide/nickel transport system ATP-binding protein